MCPGRDGVYSCLDRIDPGTSLSRCRANLCAPTRKSSAAPRSSTRADAGVVQGSIFYFLFFYFFSRFPFSVFRCSETKLHIFAKLKIEVFTYSEAFSFRGIQLSNVTVFSPLRICFVLLLLCCCCCLLSVVRYDLRLAKIQDKIAVG